MRQIRVLIVDDQIVARKGIQMFLSTDPSIQIVGEAENGQDAVRQAKSLQPDVILMDLLMPEGAGIEAIAEIKRFIPDVKVVVLTMSGDEIGFMTAMKAGADGYLLKRADGEELLQAIHAAQRGDVPLDPRIAPYQSRYSEEYGDTIRYMPLTAREKEILQLLARGVTTNDLAQELDLSESTVKTHIRNIFTKLNVSTRTEAIAVAVRIGLVSPDKDSFSRVSQNLIILRQLPPSDP
jgi:DNA-binding NarL/FixJ family response regulator